MEQGKEFIKTQRAERVLHLTIDHPPTNSVSIEILQELARLVGECENDAGVRWTRPKRRRRLQFSLGPCI